MDLFQAAEAGDEQAVQRLLAAGAAADVCATFGWLPIHAAATKGHVGMVRLLLEAAADTVSAAATHDWTPLHMAIMYGHMKVVRLLVEGAPATLTDVDQSGMTALDIALQRGAINLPAAWCLVRAASTVQPTLRSLVAAEQGAATFFVNLVSRLALTQQEWQSIPAPCPSLVRALPAVMERSVAEAGWLVGRLGQDQRARLRTGALCLGRMGAAVDGAPGLPGELSQRILVAALAYPVA